MIEQIIRENQEGQRLDKYLHKILPEAPGSFLYKMLRKKNITLNGKKATGSEMLTLSDKVQFFLAVETYEKFRTKQTQNTNAYEKAYQSMNQVEILYENQDILIANKPSGILSQKAEPKDESINEWFLGYLLHTGQINEEILESFVPSVCNRLDRNTSGIILFGKTLKGTQLLSQLLKERELEKFYLAFVPGKVQGNVKLQGFLKKDEISNKVNILTKVNEQEKENYDKIETYYKPVSYHSTKIGLLTLLEIELITGKTHQIRAHLASISHPIIGDYKYGIRAINDEAKKFYQIESQCLHAYRIVFPQLEEPFQELSSLVMEAKLPKEMEMLSKL